MNKKISILVISESEYVKDCLKETFSEKKNAKGNFYSVNFCNFSFFNEIIKSPINYDVLIINTSNISNIFLNTLNDFIAKNSFKYKCILTSLNEEQFGTMFLEAGFDGYINENLPINLIRQVIDNLLTGKITNYFLPKTKDDFINTKRNNRKKISFTLKEKKIILELGNGLNSKQIGLKFGISDKTVNVHRSNIKKKLGFTTSSELINFSFTQLNFSDIHNKTKNL